MKWTTRDGRKIEVEEMTDSHLLNAWAMLKRNLGSFDHICYVVDLSDGPCCECDAAKRCTAWIEVFTEEMRRRGRAEHYEDA